jgi:hypothetical protein
MVIVDDDTNNFDAIEYNRKIPSIILQYSKIYTNWDDNRLP